MEHEYFREGAWTYLAAWDVHRAKVFGRCEVKNGVAPVERLVSEVMGQEPYKSARRVFWIMDNAPPIVARKLSTAFVPNGRTRSSSILLSTPAGSIRSKSISRSCRGRSSRLTISLPWQNLSSVYLPSSCTMSGRRRLSNGPSRAMIFTPFWPKSPLSAWHRQPDRNTSP